MTIINVPVNIGTTTLPARSDHIHIHPFEDLLFKIMSMPEVQHKVFIDYNTAVNRKLLVSHENLIPELFSQLFLEFKDYLIFLIQHNNFKYNHPETQQLLEKALLLI